jgi:hypothetical protein
MNRSAIAVVLAACTLASPLTSQAQDAAELAKELRRLQEAMGAMQARIAELETALKDKPAQWGMTPEQSRQLGRVAVKADGLEEAIETQGLKGLKIGGWIDPTYIATSRQDRAGFQFLNSSSGGEYAFDNGTFGMAQLDIQKETADGTRWRLRLSPNRGSLGAAIDGQSIVHEASVSKPIGNLQTRLIAGQIPDWSGHEFAEATLNKLITHNLLFDYTIPAGYTGAGVELVRGKWLVKSLLANVNASKRTSGNKAPALVYRVDYYDYGREFWGFGFAGLHGKAANFRADDGIGNPVTGQPYDLRDTPAHLFEVDGFFNKANWTVTGQLGIGTQRRAAITADPVSGELRDSRWWGASAMAAYKITPRLEAIARADYLHNRANGGGLLAWTFADGRNGIGPDPSGDAEVGANRYALSLGARYAVDANLALKAEYRLDRASLPVFFDVRDGSYRRSNQLFGASMVVSF